MLPKEEGKTAVRAHVNGAKGAPGRFFGQEANSFAGQDQAELDAVFLSHDRHAIKHAHEVGLVASPLAAQITAIDHEVHG